MILYNVTVKIELDVHDDWLNWMKSAHIPEVMATECFLENRICRLLEQDETDGITYSIQYLCDSPETLEKYQSEFAINLQKDHTSRYENKFMVFRTLMELV